MVFLKRTLDHGVNGYHTPAIPRAPRSIRKRGYRQKSLEVGQVCAFELLATVAGKLLEESECSSASSSAAVGFDQCGIDKDAIKKEPQDVDKPLGGEHDDQGSSEGSVFFSGLQKEISKGKLETVNEVNGEHASPFASSACSEKGHFDLKLGTQKSNDVYVTHSSKIDGNSPKCGESHDTNIDNGLIRKLNIGGTSGDITAADKSPAPTNSEENVELTLCRGPKPNASFLKHGNDVKISCKDDDEILSQCSQPKNTVKAFRSPTDVVDRKLLNTKYWKTAPKLKDYELSNSEGGAKHNYPSKRSCYDIDRSQRNTPFKKRRLLDRSSVVTYDGGISCESVSNSPEKGIGDEKNASAGKLHEGKGSPSSGFSRQKSCNSRNSHVRLSIKSFKVPELFIEVPESTTVGSLKRTVLDAVTTILGGGLRVGVLMHGKKIRDDNRTLLQSGISQSDDMDTVGFMLEPNSPAQPSPPLCPDEPHAPLPCDSPKFVNRSQVNSDNNRFVTNSPEKPPITDSKKYPGIIKDLIPSPATELTNKIVSNSKALVPVPEASMEALAVVPVHQRSKRSDIGQRRTRRPFSVTEVESLVRAVEKLGTGRWRDVKLCAFENAKHRTYVDLKDKWKTLVHTARISPQQRRGEPVPQELLDRVLAAQSYWSEHQAKQHGKQHQQQGIFPKLTDAVTGKA
ncbi:telomere repeat-binding protein 3 [Beta vulgaris subsp. vulgaris]|uniref:telomere repeat-binding protein 3 n=1 Tax=Beta vulgaris subsp. vulgaris TaxID=3555 RepID=UPI00203733A1|nr:telomere repeat-binding protein 3 [Beta vulgaris subsp. vulgaris]